MPDGLHPLTCTPKKDKRTVSVSQEIEFVSFFFLQQTAYTNGIETSKIYQLFRKLLVGETVPKTAK
jgi:hypothetical protein